MTESITGFRNGSGNGDGYGYPLYYHDILIDNISEWRMNNRYEPQWHTSTEKLIWHKACANEILRVGVKLGVNPFDHFCCDGCAIDVLLQRGGINAKEG